MRLTLIVLVVAACAISATAAFGQQAPAKPPRTTPVQDRERLLLEKYDANGNGKVEPEEREAFRADVRRRMAAVRQQIDAKQKRETAQSREFRRRLLEQGAAILRRFDADGDGQLNAEERKAFEASRPTRPRR